jgi:hypothetical protein
MRVKNEVSSGLATHLAQKGKGQGLEKCINERSLLTSCDERDCRRKIYKRFLDRRRLGHMEFLPHTGLFRESRSVTSQTLKEREQSRNK